jgi:hypothetical protein
VSHPSRFAVAEAIHEVICVPDNNGHENVTSELVRQQSVDKPAVEIAPCYRAADAVMRLFDA